MSSSTYHEFRALALRKLIHFVFSLLLLIPLLPSFIDTAIQLGISRPTLLAYATATFGAAFVNSLQIRMPNLREEMFKFLRDLRKKSLARLESLAKSLGAQTFSKISFEELDKIFSRAEENLNTIISRLERDYERRYGYVCITFALISILLSYTLFGKYVMYGILALAVVDSVSAIMTALVPRPRIFKHSLPSILTSFTVFALLLIALSSNVVQSLALAAIAIATEALSPEDNLTLPLLTTLASYFMSMPLLI